MRRSFLQGRVLEDPDRGKKCLKYGLGASCDSSRLSECVSLLVAGRFLRFVSLELCVSLPLLHLLSHFNVRHGVLPDPQLQHMSRV